MDSSIFTALLHLIFILTNGITCFYMEDFEKKMCFFFNMMCF